MKVVVTHAGGAFAQALLPALCAHVGVDSVLALDVRPVRFAHPKLAVHAVDPLDPGASVLLAGCDALVHVPPLAFAPAETAQTPEAAVRPAHKLFHAAHAAGVKRLVHISTAAVYGAAVHASEVTALKPLPNFAYAREQAHLEQLLAFDFPDCVRLRPHLIVGPCADRRVKRLLRQPFYIRFEEPHPLYQCVHEDDVASAVLLALTADVRGAYNLAAEDSFSLRDAVRARHLLTLGLTAARAQSMLAFAARRLRWPIEPEWVALAAATLLVNCRRAVIELNWRRHYTSLEALAAT